MEMVAQWCPEREQFAGDHPCDEELFDALPEDDPSLTVRDKEFGWTPAVEVGGDAQRQWCESLRGAPASGLHFTQEWKRYAAHIRSFGCKLALEVFAGTCIITSILAEWGIPVAPPVEILIFEWMDLLNPMFVYLLIGLILEGRFWFLWLAPPCSTFSMACNRFIATMLRNSTHVEGLPWLRGKAAEKVRIGNGLRDVALTLAKAQTSIGETFALEQPGSSLMLESKPYREMEKDTKATRAYRDQCRDGAPWRKSTCITSNDPRVVAINGSCPGCPNHILLQGRNREGVSWTKIASSYWPSFARSCLKPLCDRAPSEKERYQAGNDWRGGIGPDAGELSVLQILDRLSHPPSGKRHKSTIASSVSAGVQPSRQGLPQLIPDVLTPETHSSLAQNIAHPFALPPSVHPAIAKALSEQEPDVAALVGKRQEALVACERLEAQVRSENDDFLLKLHPWVRQVLQSGGMTKQIAFMRELAFICNAPDLQAMPALCVGTRMLGRALPIEGMPSRAWEPQATIAEYRAERLEWNAKVESQAKRVTDVALVTKAWEKSLAEAQRGVVLGPFRELAEVPVASPSLCWRKAVWETRNGEQEVRVIDDMLVSGQNSTAGYESTHVPMTSDAVAAQVRSVNMTFPEATLAGFPSDFAKAYKQVPEDPVEVENLVLAQFEPDKQCLAYWLPLTLLFGGRLAPLLFTRFPAFMIHIVAVLFCIAMQHCVDDLLNVERELTIQDCHKLWMKLCRLTGWDVPLAKTPVPARKFTVIGIEIDLSPLPSAHALVRITSARVEALLATLLNILVERKCTSKTAAKIFGQLGFAAASTYGRVGRAKLWPFKRRQFEDRQNVHPQMVAAVRWWQRFLRDYVPRHVPMGLVDARPVVTYSDGEGGKAGVGICIFRRGCKPRAAFTAVHRSVRRLWASQSRSDGRWNDIFQIEAVGPLLVAETWPEDLEGQLWLHFIDNTAAQSTLIRGSSSVLSGDAIAGYTWALVAKLRASLWVDRVCSKSNPIDGVSRGRTEGPWSSVRPIGFPSPLLEDLAKAWRDMRECCGSKSS